MSEVLVGWTKGSFTYDNITHDTYRQGSGPGVIVIHEVPGITPKVAAFGQDVVDAGFTVTMPSLFGTPGKPATTGYGLNSMVRACVSREFATWALGETSKATEWCRALARSLHEELGGPGVGALGMCLTGGFALAMMVDERLVAPVLSQPSLPLPIGKARGAALNLSPRDLARVKARAAAGCEVLGLRYKNDPFVGTRFDTLRKELGDKFIAVELDGPKSNHSVLTEHRDEASVQRVLEFFAAKLKP